MLFVVTNIPCGVGTISAAEQAFTCVSSHVRFVELLVHCTVLAVGALQRGLAGVLVDVQLQITRVIGLPITDIMRLLYEYALRKLPLSHIVLIARITK